MIRVEAPPGGAPRLNEPVEVTGVLSPAESRVVAFVADGPAVMHAAWRLEAETLAPPPPATLERLLKGAIGQEAAAAIVRRFGR
jgi:hypothetical protein